MWKPYYTTNLEAAILGCFYEKVFWIYAKNLQEKTHAEVQFQ